MFKFAESGIVAWPTEFPVDQDGLPTPTKVLVRYRVLTRAELRTLDTAEGIKRRDKIADAIVKMSAPIDTADGVDTARAEAERRGRITQELIEQEIKYQEAHERDRTERLLLRVVSIQPPGETEFAEFAPGELARQLEFEVLAKAYEAALLDASKAAVAKN
ncbi:MAG: hypothetical protein ACK51F_10695 [Rhodospirillales bacterium]|jgi:hypothetical protein